MSGTHECHTCASVVGLNESAEPLLPKDDGGEDVQRSCEIDGNRFVTQFVAAGDSTTLLYGGPISPFVENHDERVYVHRQSHSHTVNPAKMRKKLWKPGERKVTWNV